MEKKYLCTIRPFDCEKYTHDHQCGYVDGGVDDKGKLKRCEYAKEAPITADEIEPDMIDRDILRRMRQMGVAERARLDANFEYKKAKPADESDIKEFDEKVKEVVNMNTNHEFPASIASLLEVLGYEKKEYRYYGIGRNITPNKSMIEFGVDGNMLLCKNMTTLKLIFTVDMIIPTAFLLVLMQAYGIVHHRYIYERVEAAYEDFWDNQEQ